MANGLRLVVAGIGVVVLVAVAIFFVTRTVIGSDLGSLGSGATSEQSVVPSEVVPPEPEPTGGGGGGDPSPPGPSEQGSGEPEPDPGEPIEPYIETSKAIQNNIDGVGVDVEVPQVEGGKPEVAQTFNKAMESALRDQVDTLTAASPLSTSVKDGTGSGVYIGEQVLSGVLRTSARRVPDFTTIPLASSVVVDTSTGTVMTLESLFTNLTAGLQRLEDLSDNLGSTSTAGAKFDGTKLAPEEELFSQWGAGPAGMHIYFEQGAVASDAEGVVELTIPWDNLHNVLKPGVEEIVAS